jgi:hypothetical protein
MGEQVAICSAVAQLHGAAPARRSRPRGRLIHQPMLGNSEPWVGERRSTDSAATARVPSAGRRPMAAPHLTPPVGVTHSGQRRGRGVGLNLPVRTSTSECSRALRRGEVRPAIGGKSGARRAAVVAVDPTACFCGRAFVPLRSAARHRPAAPLGASRVTPLPRSLHRPTAAGANDHREHRSRESGAEGVVASGRRGSQREQEYACSPVATPQA